MSATSQISKSVLTLTKPTLCRGGVLTDRQLFSFLNGTKIPCFPYWKDQFSRLNAAYHLLPVLPTTASSTMEKTNTLMTNTQTQVSLCPVIRAALCFSTVTAGPSLTTTSLWLLPNNQRTCWMEQFRITMETISRIYKAGGNFLCKRHMESKGTNLCHAIGTYQV